MSSRDRSNHTFADFMKVVHHSSLRGIPRRTFPLTEVAAAHQAMEDRDFYGEDRY